MCGENGESALFRFIVPWSGLVNILDAQSTKPLKGGPSFSIRNRLIRLVWNWVWFLLASWSPPSFRLVRIGLLRLFGADVAWSANVYSSTQIWFPANLVMRSYACLGPKVNCYCMATITVEEYAIVSQGAHLCTGTHDIEDPNFQLYAKPIHIGTRAWVAAEAFIGPGVTVHDRAVIGARAVLFKDAVESGVYIGNPAIMLKVRQTV